MLKHRIKDIIKSGNELRFRKVFRAASSKACSNDILLLMFSKFVDLGHSSSKITISNMLNFVFVGFMLYFRKIITFGKCGRITFRKIGKQNVHVRS